MMRDGLRMRAPRLNARRLRFTLLAGTMLTFGVVGLAKAQNASAPREAASAISVPAGLLTPALNRLAAQARIQIVFDAALANGKTTQGVSGALTPAQALNAVLAGKPA